MELVFWAGIVFFIAAAAILAVWSIFSEDAEQSRPHFSEHAPERGQPKPRDPAIQPNVSQQMFRVSIDRNYKPSGIIPPGYTAEQAAHHEAVIAEAIRVAIAEESRRIVQRTFRIAGFTKPARSGRGIRYLLYQKLSHGQSLRFVREPDNPVSKTAVLIYPLDGEFVNEDLGYVPEFLSSWVYQSLEEGFQFDCVITRIETEESSGLWMLFVKARKRKQPKVRKASAT